MILDSNKNHPNMIGYCESFALVCFVVVAMPIFKHTDQPFSIEFVSVFSLLLLLDIAAIVGADTNSFLLTPAFVEDNAASAHCVAFLPFDVVDLLVKNPNYLLLVKFVCWFFFI